LNESSVQMYSLLSEHTAHNTCNAVICSALSHRHTDGKVRINQPCTLNLRSKGLPLVSLRSHGGPGPPHTHKCLTSPPAGSTSHGGRGATRTPTV
jgi:hypothetical protein